MLTMLSTQNIKTWNERVNTNSPTFTCADFMSELDKITKIYLLDLVINFSSNRGSERSLSVIWHFASYVAERHGPGWKCHAFWTCYSRPPSLTYPSSHQQTAPSTGMLLHWQDGIITKITLHTTCVLHFAKQNILN